MTEKTKRVTSPRKDHVALEAAGEMSETAAAKLIGVTTSTLSKWRAGGFSAQGLAISWRRAHSRLIAYSRASVEAFVAHRLAMA